MQKKFEFLQTKGELDVSSVFFCNRFTLEQNTRLIWNHWRKIQCSYEFTKSPVNNKRESFAISAIPQHLESFRGLTH